MPQSDWCWGGSSLRTTSRNKFLSGSNGAAFHACEAAPIFSRMCQGEDYTPVNRRVSKLQRASEKQF